MPMVRVGVAVARLRQVGSGKELVSEGGLASDNEDIAIVYTLVACYFATCTDAVQAPSTAEHFAANNTMTLCSELQSGMST